MRAQFLKEEKHVSWKGKKARKRKKASFRLAHKNALVEASGTHEEGIQ